MERKALEKYLTLVAHYLGDGWRVDTREEHTLSLICQKKKIRTSVEKTKINYVSGINAPYSYGSASALFHKIGVSSNRSPKVAAKEIVRRLMPNYLQSLEEYNAAEKNARAIKKKRF